ncbi:hypothetical protein [Aminobacter niigataensis]|nr:hypothetical protein [Aminobacter niigataensis]
MVEAMAAVVTQEEIAIVMEIDTKTLRRHYRVELDRALVIANSKVGLNLFKIATGKGREAVTAAIFWMKTRAGWSEYSPPPKPPAPPKEPAPGKKELAEREANERPGDPEWGDLVGTGRRPN